MQRVVILFVIDPSENGLIVWFDDVSGLMVKARQEQLEEFTTAHCSAVLICWIECPAPSHPAPWSLYKIPNVPIITLPTKTTGCGTVTFRKTQSSGFSSNWRVFLPLYKMLQTSFRGYLLYVKPNHQGPLVLQYSQLDDCLWLFMIAHCTSNLWVISHGLHVGSHKGKVEENNVSEKCWKIGKGFNEALFKEASKSEKNYRGYQSTRLSKCLRIIIKVKSTFYRFAEE